LKPSSGFSLPPTLVILGIILFIACLAAEMIPPGEYARTRQMIVVDGVQWQDIEATDPTVAQVAAREALSTQLAELAEKGRRPPEVYAAMQARLSESHVPRQLNGQWQVPILKTANRTVVERGTYQQLERPEAGNAVAMIQTIVGRFLQGPMAGFKDKAEVIAFVLIIGGAFGIILATGAIDAGLRVAVASLEQRNIGWAIIPVVMIIFSLGGATFGLSEEVIPFVMITIPLAIRLGYDSITGLCLSWMAAGIGFATALTNPFTVGVAQGIAGVQPFSGMGFRLLCWVLATGIGIAYVMRWAMKVKRNPELSPVRAVDRELIHAFEAPDRHDQPFGWREGVVLIIVTLMVLMVGYGAVKFDWYLSEMTALFIGAAILCGIVGRVDLEGAAKAFAKGASELTPAALIIAFSAGILQVLQAGKVLDTILFWIDSALGDLPGAVGASLMFVFHTILNFFMPSGSGQAAVTMPLMAPLADIMGISRQTAVLAFQFGDGFGNMIIPTSAVTMTVLGIARLPWEKWVRWVLPLQLLYMAFGVIMLLIATLIGYE
jgi:uncharacterized ion transporter superfamily protein YfcC